MVIKLHHALIGFLLFVLLLSALRNAQSLSQNMPFFSQLQKEYNREKARNRALKLQYAQSKDPYEIEKTLRDKLGYSTTDEKVLLFTAPSTSPTLSPTPSR